LKEHNGELTTGDRSIQPLPAPAKPQPAGAAPTEPVAHATPPAAKPASSPAKPHPSATRNAGVVRARSSTPTPSN